MGLPADDYAIVRSPLLFQKETEGEASAKGEATEGELIKTLDCGRFMNISKY